MNPQLSVIVLNYNGRDWLRPCLTALASQVGAPRFETIVADNGSTDGSVDLVAATFPDVRLIRHRENLGFAGGNNRAAAVASAPLLVFLNNDTLVAPDWLARLHAAHIEAPDRQIVASRIVFLNQPDVVDSAGDGYMRAGGAFKRGHGTKADAFLESREVFGACGAAFLITRSLFDELHGFDESFFMVYEDVDLAYRARLAGYRCWYAADAVVRHASSGTLGSASSRAVFYGQRNLEWTWFKNTPAGLFWRTLPSHFLYSIAGVLHYVAKGRGGPAIRGKMAALAGLPRMLSARRTVQRARRADAASIERHLERGWIARKRLEKAPLTVSERAP